MLFDTHTHVNAEEFDNEVPETVQRAIENDVTRMAVVGFDTETIEKSLALNKQYEEIYSIIGWHPTESYLYTEEIEEKLYHQLQLPKVVAMGEMGLDYHWDTSPKDVQKDVFHRQIQIAKELKLPISIHMRDSIEDTYELMKKNMLKMLAELCTVLVEIHYGWNGS